MTNKELLDLLEKFKNGACNDQEKKTLYQFYESFQNKDSLESWNALEIENSRIRLLQRINETIVADSPIRQKKHFYKQLAAAAILVGLFTSVLIFRNNDGSGVVIPKDAITLELEDGRIEILNESAHFLVRDEEGKEVGKQNGTALVYHASQETKKLTYNTLKVPYGKTFNLQLSDGTKVKLNSGSSLKYPVKFIEGKERLVFIVGEAYLDVAKDADSPFIVNANELNVKVFGTQFNVHAYPEDHISEVVLVEGSVGLYRQDVQDPNALMTHLTPGFKASFSKKTKHITKSAVLTSIYTSWIEGELVFRDMDFDNILKKLERYYDVEIINNNKNLSGQKFQASFGKKPEIEEVFKELKMIYGIDYSIQGKTITIK